MLINGRTSDLEAEDTCDKVNQDDQQAINGPLTNGKYRDRNFSLYRSSMDDSMLYPNSSIFKVSLIIYTDVFFIN